MPVKVFKKGKNKFCVFDAATGKAKNPKGRCHKTYKQAMAQMRAINASLKREGKI